MMARPRAYLEQILQSLDRIASYAAQGSRAFFESPLLQYGVVHNLELIGASVKELSADLLAEYPGIPWSSIARMRDRLAHRYLGSTWRLCGKSWATTCRPLKRLSSPWCGRWAKRPSRTYLVPGFTSGALLSASNHQLSGALAGQGQGSLGAVASMPRNSMGHRRNRLGLKLLTGRMPMDVEYCVIREHKRIYDEGIQFRCGEPVEIGRRDTRWSSWLWCTTATGVGAWVPEQLLKSSDQTRAVVTTDYNSIELTVTPGELVTGTQVLAGWIWCRNAHNDEGWVPLENLQSAAS